MPYGIPLSRAASAPMGAPALLHWHGVITDFCQEFEPEIDKNLNLTEGKMKRHNVSKTYSHDSYDVCSTTGMSIAQRICVCLCARVCGCVHVCVCVILTMCVCG